MAYSALLFLFFLLLLPLSLSAPTQLIRKTCNTTTYYDFCVSSLDSDPHSPTADVKGLSTIAINLAVSNATNTSAYTATLAQTSSDPVLRSLLTTCSTKYAYAKEALQSSLDEMAAESYDYAFVQVSAAAEYPGVCRVLFKQKTKVVYPAELARREEALERLCTIALEIISLLG